MVVEVCQSPPPHEPLPCLSLPAVAIRPQEGRSRIMGMPLGFLFGCCLLLTTCNVHDWQSGNKQNKGPWRAFASFISYICYNLLWHNFMPQLRGWESSTESLFMFIQLMQCGFGLKTHSQSSLDNHHYHKLVSAFNTVFGEAVIMQLWVNCSNKTASFGVAALPGFNKRNQIKLYSVQSFLKFLLAS